MIYLIHQQPKRKLLSLFALKMVALVGCVLISSCNTSTDKEGTTESAEQGPLFKNSITSTDIDFITDEDPNSFVSLEYLGQAEHEMPDRRNDVLMDDSTFVFEAAFSDGNKVEIWAHSLFESVSEAKKYAQMLTDPLGKLPKFMRKTLLHVVVHKGDETAFGESEGHFFVLYSQNMETRISNHDLEETVFHESVHATLDSDYQKDEKWLQAQQDDGIFITEYGASKPNLEDLAESAIFAYTMIKHPNRLSKDIEDWITQNAPNRLAFFRTIFN